MSSVRFAGAKVAAKSSTTATVLAVVTALVGLVVGLGIVNVQQQGIIIATTTAGIAVAGVIANAIHSGNVEPSAIVAAVGAVVAQAVALLVSFAWISSQTAGTVVAITAAVVLAAAQIAHTLLSKQVP